jgi:hypothetical protein
MHHARRAVLTAMIKHTGTYALVCMSIKLITKPLSWACWIPAFFSKKVVSNSENCINDSWGLTLSVPKGYSLTLELNS